MGVATPGCTALDEQGCEGSTSDPPTRAEIPNWFEEPVMGGFRVWQIMFLCLAAVMTVVIFLCCCIRFRIPRTKQEIEADYVRKKITRKFQKQLRCIQNADMDDMDLKRALDRVRAEFKSDTESVAPSEATLSSGGCNCNQEAPQLLLAPPDIGDNTYTKGSDLLIAAAEEDDQEPQSRIGKKFASLVQNTLVMFRTSKQQTE